MWNTMNSTPMDDDTPLTFDEAYDKAMEELEAWNNAELLRLLTEAINEADDDDN